MRAPEIGVEPVGKRLGGTLVKDRFRALVCAGVAGAADLYQVIRVAREFRVFLLAMSALVNPNDFFKDLNFICSFICLVFYQLIQTFY